MNSSFWQPNPSSRPPKRKNVLIGCLVQGYKDSREPRPSTCHYCPVRLSISPSLRMGGNWQPCRHHLFLGWRAGRRWAAGAANLPRGRGRAARPEQFLGREAPGVPRSAGPCGAGPGEGRERGVEAGPGRGRRRRKRRERSGRSHIGVSVRAGGAAAAGLAGVAGR